MKENQNIVVYTHLKQKTFKKMFYNYINISQNQFLMLNIFYSVIKKHQMKN